MARVQKFFEKPSRTQQSFKEECDINLILKKYKKVMNTDYLEQFNGLAGGQFGDFSQVGDYRSALDQVNAAKAAFGALPALVRKRFGNDPAEFLDFCLDPKNGDDLVKWGLASKRPIAPPVSAET